MKHLLIHKLYKLNPFIEQKVFCVPSMRFRDLTLRLRSEVAPKLIGNIRKLLVKKSRKYSAYISGLYLHILLKNRTNFFKKEIQGVCYKA